MRQYHIYHCTTELAFTEKQTQPRTYAGYVDADSLETAYQKSQNLTEPWNTVFPCRSTSVGDVIQGEDGFYMVSGVGFTKLTDR
jgi:hypothetical protein